MTVPDPLVLWLLPLSWLVHDIEELVAIEGWSDRWRDAPGMSTLQRRLVERMVSTRRRFAVAVALVGCVVVGATVAGVLEPDGIGILVYTTVLGGYSLHGFVHVGGSLVFRGHTPGLLTAVSLVIPVPVTLYRRLLGAGLLAPEVAVATGVVGFVVFLPVVVLANRLAARIERTLG
jgi:hypothetical protein